MMREVKTGCADDARRASCAARTTHRRARDDSALAVLIIAGIEGLNLERIERGETRELRRAKERSCARSWPAWRLRRYHSNTRWNGLSRRAHASAQKSHDSTSRSGRPMRASPELGRLAHDEHVALRGQPERSRRHSSSASQLRPK